VNYEQTLRQRYGLGPDRAERWFTLAIAVLFAAAWLML